MGDLLSGEITKNRIGQRKVIKDEKSAMTFPFVKNKNILLVTFEKPLILVNRCVIGDSEGEDRADAKAFLARWRKEISRRVGAAERQAAEISREKRLAEFEELRRNGNIIRNGKLAGKLLVDMLKADFREYNEEYIAV